MAAISTSGESPEVFAIRQNLVALNDTISGNLPWFATELVEKAFITQEQSSGILGIHGIEPAEKARRLLDSVFTALRNTSRKKERFDMFIAIFSPEAAYAELVDKLKRSHASANSDTQTAESR